MDERLRKLRLERGQALLESCRMRDFDRSPEETARLKQRGRVLYEERLRAEEKGSPCVEMRYHSDAVIDLCSIPVKEGQAATEKTHGLSYLPPQSVELLSESRRDGDNISTSHDCTTAIIDYSILDSVREQHIRDVRQIEILTKESHLLQETIEKQQEALTKLAAELAQRDAQIQCNLKNDARKLLPPDEKETGVRYDGGSHHMQEMVPAMRPRAQDNRRNPHLETSEDLHDAESLLARKQVEIQELQLKLQEKILYCNKLGEENKNLNKNNQQLQEDVVALLKKVCMIQEELINTTEEGNLSQKTVIYLEHKIKQMQSEYKPHTPVPESTHMEEELERLARQCADAEATMHRMEAEMAAENAKLKEELCRMQQSHEEEIEAALLEASDRIAEHDDLLRHKLEEQEAELEARFLEQLNSFKEPGGDSDALHSLLSLKEENAKLKEELCRMQQSHEEERQAAGAAMHRMEAEMRSQQQTQLAGPPRRAAASSTNPFASMGALSKEPGSFPDQGDDGDDVFGVGTEQHPTATGDAVSVDRQAEPEGLVTELRGRLAELEAALSSATLARDSAVGEVERLARQCADAEATMHRMEAEMAAENAKLKEELCRMQQSHEEERQAAGAAMHRMEAEMRSQQQTQLAGPPRRAAASSTNPFASMGALSKEPGSFPDQGDDGDDVFGVGTEQHPTATGDAVSVDRQAEPEGLVTELRGRLAELEAALSSATLARDSAVGEVERLARQCADAEATMHRMEAEMAAENAKLKEELCRMQQSHEEERQAAGAAMHRMEAEMRSQQQTQLAGPPRRAAASSTNPFASMGALSKEPGSFPDQGDDGDDVFWRWHRAAPHGDW
ncbi:hypothetical protein C3747_7g322 [Trypanosoma cruzi]|uniref:Uncharacterized protein n=1 Tax=Trypanosoma cruzi TaxID=5693 RepID=A0A2V2XJS4_TRYCR|nr:hypothetical protein C3747_7g322 [Trypanosoma cruzi]